MNLGVIEMSLDEFIFASLLVETAEPNADRSVRIAIGSKLLFDGKICEEQSWIHQREDHKNYPLGHFTKSPEQIREHLSNVAEFILSCVSEIWENDLWCEPEHRKETKQK